MNKIKQGWGEYFAGALREIKERFEQINSATMVKNVEQQKLQAEALDRELEKVSGEVQQLEMDVQSTTST